MKAKSKLQYSDLYDWLMLGNFLTLFVPHVYIPLGSTCLIIHFLFTAISFLVFSSQSFFLIEIIRPVYDLYKYTTDCKLLQSISNFKQYYIRTVYHLTHRETKFGREIRSLPFPEAVSYSLGLRPSPKSTHRPYNFNTQHSTTNTP